jgi:hypothetical protein
MANDEDHYRAEQHQLRLRVIDAASRIVAAGIAAGWYETKHHAVADMAEVMDALANATRPPQ